MRVVLCTCPPEAADGIAKTLVSAHLAACVNIVPLVRSIYRWKGELCDDAESLLIIKTQADRVADLTVRLLDCHPYDVPEVIALPIEHGEGNPRYLEWLVAQTTPPTD
jgi:periplasmic divalent cation tolerance protein